MCAGFPHTFSSMHGREATNKNPMDVEELTGVFMKKMSQQSAHEEGAKKKSPATGATDAACSGAQTETFFVHQEPTVFMKKMSQQNAPAPGCGCDMCSSFSVANDVLVTPKGGIQEVSTATEGLTAHAKFVGLNKDGTRLIFEVSVERQQKKPACVHNYVELELSLKCDKPVIVCSGWPAYRGSVTSKFHNLTASKRFHVAVEVTQDIPISEAVVKLKLYATPPVAMTKSREKCTIRVDAFQDPK